MQLKKILLPIDLAETNLRLARQAAFLGRRFGSEIVLLHVVQPLGYLEATLVSGARDLHEKMIEQAHQDLENSLQGEFAGVGVRRLLVTGQPAKEIVATARTEEVDLIVMATHGEGPFYRLLLGSVTGKVLHEVNCPVWTGAHLEEVSADEFAIRRVLCAIDLTEHAVHTLKEAADFAQGFGATLTVAHVTGGVESFGPGGEHVDPEWKQTLVSFASKEIARLQGEAGTKADVLIVGRTPPGGHLGQHGEGYSIIRDARVPVLSI